MKWRCDTPTSKAVSQRNLRDTLWKQGKWVRYPPLRYYLERVLRDMGGISHWAAKLVSVPYRYLFLNNTAVRKQLALMTLFFTGPCVVNVAASWQEAAFWAELDDEDPLVAPQPSELPAQATQAAPTAANAASKDLHVMTSLGPVCIIQGTARRSFQRTSDVHFLPFSFSCPASPARKTPEPSLTHPKLALKHPNPALKENLKDQASTSGSR